MNNQLDSNLPHEKYNFNESSNNWLIVGNRIPKDYFITSGTGESNIAIHSGSYHLALRKAGIEKENIITYSSMLPAIATQIQMPDNLVYGAVMETIMAVANGRKEERLSAGIIYGWLYDRNKGEKHCGLVCEHNGNYSEKELVEILESSITELYINSFEKEFEFRDREIIKESFVPIKKYGTALVALCFTNYVYPVIKQKN